MIQPTYIEGIPFQLALKFIQDSLAFIQPQLLRLLLSYITHYQEARTNPDDPRPSPYTGFAIAFCMFFAAMCQTTLLHQVGSLPVYVRPASDIHATSISNAFMRQECVSVLA